MRVWHVGPHPDAQGGISTVIRVLLQAQAGTERLRVSHLPTMVTGGKFTKAITMARAWIRLLIAASLRRVDVLHVHTSAGSSLRRKALFMGLARHLGLPYLLQVHGSTFDTWYLESSSRDQAWIRRQMNHAVEVIALSESWRDFLTEHTTTRVRVVYNSVSLHDTVWPRPVRNPGPLRMVFLGLLGERKGVFDLLRAVKQVAEGPHGVQIELTIGGDGEIEETLDLIDTLGLNSSVQFLGWIGAEAKRSLLAQSDVFVLPSYHEGLPMAILEAMSAGCAVISTAINGIPEAVRDGETGFLLRPGDVDALAESIRTLAHDPVLATRLGKAGRRVIESKFDVRLAVEAFSEAYRSAARAAAHETA